MCTAFAFQADGCYFGRTLDLECSYGEQLCISPRNYPFVFRKKPTLSHHYAVLGMAKTVGGTPLYYDGFNEKGLAMAGLNFPYSCKYHPEQDGKDNITPFELIPWVLGQCETVRQAAELLQNTSLLNEPFSPQLPLSPLHFIIGDKKETLVVESTKEGLSLYDNPSCVMANEPPLPFQLHNLSLYRGVGIKTPENTFSPAAPLPVYCQGIGGVGLPGDVSSPSRFVRAAFGVANALRENPVGQVFHILDSVAMIKGLCLTDTGHWDYTVYSACMDTKQGVYHYKTYDNPNPVTVCLQNWDLEGTTPIAV